MLKVTLPLTGGGYRCGTANEGRGQLGWDGLSRTGGKTESRGDSRSVMETVERREEDSCCSVDHTLLSAHISQKGLELIEMIRSRCQEAVLCDCSWPKNKQKNLVAAPKQIDTNDFKRRLCERENEICRRL